MAEHMQSPIARLAQGYPGRSAVSHRLRALLLGDRFRVGLIRSLILYGLLSSFAILFLIPFYWMLKTALTTDGQVFTVPPIWFPNPIQWSNFADSMRYTGGTVSTGTPVVYRYALNTALITLNGVVGTLLASSIAAYAFARLTFPGKNVLFLGILSTLMIPFAVVMVPQFIIWKTLNWLDTFWPLMVPQWAGSAWNIFLLRQFFMTIPKEYDESALIDGASRFSIYWRIVMPLATPALAAVTVFAFMYFWNDFMGPLIILSSPKNFTLTLYLVNFSVAYSRTTPWNLYMAAALIIVLPCLILFFFSQEAFMKGITITDIKR